VLSYNLEEFVNYCPMMGKKFSGLATRSIERMAFELALKWSCPYIFSTARKSRLEGA
jgi:hypothetical protein